MWEACDGARNAWTRPLDSQSSFCPLLHWIGFLCFASTPFLIMNIIVSAGSNCVITIQHSQYLFFFKVTKMRYLKALACLKYLHLRIFPTVYYYMPSQPQLLNVQHSHILLQFSSWSLCFAKVLLHSSSRKGNFLSSCFPVVV